MRKSVWMKGLVLGIILLFFGAGVTPISTNFTVQADDGNSNFGFEISNKCECGDNDNDSNSLPKLLTENTIYYYNSVAYTCFGWSAGGTVQRAIRITSAELSGYSGWTLKAGRFYHCSSNPCTGYLKIYGQGTPTSPGSLLAQKSFSASGVGWIRIDLVQPIQLDITKDYWISIEMPNIPGEYVMGADNGPAVDGKGDWVYHPDTGWYELQYQSGTPHDVNYNIEAIVSSSSGNRPPVANAGGPYNAEPGIEIQFDGSNSYDPDGYITSYEWNFGDGQTGSGKKPKHTYSNEKDYTVTLTVTDNSPTRASSSATTYVPIWFLQIFIIETSASNDVNIRGITDPFWSNTNPSRSKNLADSLDNTGSGYFTVTTKFFAVSSPSKLKFEYSYYIYDQAGKQVKYEKRWKDATGSGHNWEGSFNVILPQKVGKYTFSLGIRVLFNLKIIPTNTLYVTWASPSADVSPPRERWLDIATTWASGANSEVTVAEKLIDSEYANPFNWVYGYYPEDRFTRDLDTLIDSNTGDSSDCYGFAYVWNNLARVNGLNSGTEDYQKVGGFLTSTTPAIDDNYDANARNKNNNNKRDRWCFGAHCIGKLLSKSTNEYYDPTFGMKGFDVKDTGAVYIYDSLVGVNPQGFYTYSKQGSSEKKLVKYTNDPTPHQWSIVDYKDPTRQNMFIPVSSTSHMTDTGLDIDGNGLFDYLMTNLPVNVPQSGVYYINGILHVNHTLIASGSNNLSIGKNLSSLGIQEHLNAGVNNITLFFNGKNIFDAHINGPYNLSLIIVGNTTTIQQEFLSSSYTYTQFQGLLLEIMSFSEHGEDDDSDGLFENLTINLQVNALKNGNYSIQTTLYYNEQTIDSKQVTLYLTQGTSTITLKFDGRKVYQTRQNGPYVISLSISDTIYHSIISSNTTAYNYTDFEKPDAYFTGNFYDYGTDINDNGFYEYLTIEAEIYVRTSGNYIIQGNVKDDTTWATHSAYYNQGSQQVILQFDGTPLYKTWENGPYPLSHIAIFNEDNSLIDAISNSYTTVFYNYSDFEPPTAFIQDVYSDYGIDTNNNGLYDYLAVQINLSLTLPGNYTLIGTLNAYNNNEIIDITTSISFLVPFYQSSVLLFNGSTIYQHGVNGPYVLGSISLYNDNGTLMDIQNKIYTTFAYHFNDFEHTQENPPLERAILLGLITDKNVNENYTTFNAQFLIYINLENLTIYIFRSNEKLMVSNDNQLGYIGQQFIIGAFDTAIMSYTSPATVNPIRNRLKQLITPKS